MYLYVWIRLMLRMRWCCVCPLFVFLQAQACFYEKAVKDRVKTKLKPTIIAKLASKAGEVRWGHATLFYMLSWNSLRTVFNETRWFSPYAVPEDPLFMQRVYLSLPCRRHFLSNMELSKSWFSVMVEVEISCSSVLCVMWQIDCCRYCRRCLVFRLV